MPRFFAPGAGANETLVELPADEASHLTRVLRLAPGGTVRVFDGRGGEWLATIDEAHRQRATVRLGDRVVPAPEPSIPITLAVAVLKGEKMDDVVRDAVMLGVAAVQPLLTSRTETRPAAAAARLARWQRIALSSVKQCGRAVVPPVRPPCDLDGALVGGEPAVMLVEPGAGGAVPTLATLPRPERALLVIGPEGGWTETEVQLAASRGAMLLTLGGQTLRAAATPIIALTAIRVQWGDF